MIFPFLVIRPKSGQYIQIPQKKQIINADWLRWVGDDMLSIYIVFRYGYLVALDLAYRKNIYCYNGNNSIIDNDRTMASSRRSS